MGLGRGGECRFYFYGRGIFLIYSRILMAHSCGDPNRATQCRAWSVASNSCRSRDVAPKSRYTPPPPQIKVSHLSPDPPVVLSSHSQQAGGRGEGVATGWWRVAQHFWVPKTDRATGGCRSYSHTSGATLCK